MIILKLNDNLPKLQYNWAPATGEKLKEQLYLKWIVVDHNIYLSVESIKKKENPFVKESLGHETTTIQPTEQYSSINYTDCGCRDQSEHERTQAGQPEGCKTQTTSLPKRNLSLNSRMDHQSDEVCTTLGAHCYREWPMKSGYPLDILAHHSFVGVASYTITKSPKLLECSFHSMGSGPSGSQRVLGQSRPLFFLSIKTSWWISFFFNLSH